MTATLTRLQQHGFLRQVPEGMPVDTYLRELPGWLDEQDAAFHSRMVREHSLLQLEYNVVCANLAAGFSRESSSASVLRPGVEAALAIAEMLRRLYRDHLGAKSELKRLNDDILLYRRLLECAGYDLGAAEVDAPEDYSGLTGIARTLFSHGNWARLMTGRARRVLIAVSEFGRGVGQFSKWVAKVDKGLGPAMAWIGFLYFIPRFLANSLLLIRHLVPGSWMPETEKQIDFGSRVLGQMQRRGLEFFNDAAWLPTGILSCFVLIGALGPAGAYLTFAMFVYDVLAAAIRALYECLRLKRLWDAYAAIEARTEEEQEELESLKDGLRSRCKLELVRLGSSVLQTLLLAGVMVLLLPAFTANPLLALIGASLVLMVTSLAWMVDNWLKTQASIPDMRPLDTESARSRFSFFARKESACSSPAEAFPCPAF